MKVLFCHPDEALRKKYVRQIRRIAGQSKIPVSIQEGGTAQQLIFDASDEREQFDLIYLDVYLPDADGVKTAECIRKLGVRSALVFVTRERGRVFEAFDVDAMHYLITDDVQEEKFAEVFLKAAQRMDEQNAEVLALSCAGEYRRVRLSDIRYFEVRDRIITVHYLGEAFDFYSTLTKIEEMLFGRGFQRIHRSFLVSDQYIAAVCRGSVHLTTGEVLPMSRKYYEKNKDVSAASDSIVFRPPVRTLAGGGKK